MSQEVNDQSGVKVQFSAEQQEIFNREVAKLRREAEEIRKAGDERTEEVRKAGAARIAQLTNATDADTFLQASRLKSDADAQAKAELDKLFKDGAACNKMAKEDPTLYRQLKARYQQLGGLGGVPPVAPKTGGARAFSSNM